MVEDLACQLEGLIDGGVQGEPSSSRVRTHLSQALYSLSSSIVLGKVSRLKNNENSKLMFSLYCSNHQQCSEVKSTLLLFKKSSTTGQLLFLYPNFSHQIIVCSVNVCTKQIGFSNFSLRWLRITGLLLVTLGK